MLRKLTLSRFRRAAISLPVLVTCVLALACSDVATPTRDAAHPAGQDVLRPLDEILAGPVGIADLSAEAATVRVQTSKPVMCSVVYGIDDRYGSQSTDPDMGGQPHTDHRAPLRGLPPDSVIHYRIQGAAPDGAIYVSRDLTFQTPPSGAAAGARRNLASLQAGARIAEASSVFGSSPAWKAENAIDGDPRTEWSSQGDGNRAFLTVDLGKVTEVAEVGAWTRTMGTSAQISSFRVVGDGGIIAGPFDLPDALRLHSFPVRLTTRLLRFEVVSSSGGNAGFVEVGAYGKE